MKSLERPTCDCEGVEVHKRLMGIIGRAGRGARVGDPNHELRLTIVVGVCETARARLITTASCIPSL